jgi:ADP-ribosylglycohydrolase
MKKSILLGAIAGDVIGSVYERHNVKRVGFPLFSEACEFTDVSILTVAIADSILNKKDFADTIKEYAKAFPNAGYGSMFREWVNSDLKQPYNSFGNGSAMRVSPVGVAYNHLPTILEVAKQTAEVTHNHPEGVKGAQAVASAIFLAKIGYTKFQIKNYITSAFGYNLNDTIENIRQEYSFDASCQGSVPQSIIAFLDSTDYENAIRLAISIGGDSDTIACIAGGIAAAYYKEIPNHIIDFVTSKLPVGFISLIKQFDKTFNNF